LVAVFLTGAFATDFASLLLILFSFHRQRILLAANPTPPTMAKPARVSREKFNALLKGWNHVDESMWPFYESLRAAKTWDHLQRQAVEEMLRARMGNALLAYMEGSPGAVRELLDLTPTRSRGDILLAPPRMSLRECYKRMLTLKGRSGFSVEEVSVHVCSNASSGVDEGRFWEGHECESCGIAESKTGRPAFRCGACRRTRYCSRECQLADWPRHKGECGVAEAGTGGENAAIADARPVLKEVGRRTGTFCLVVRC
jgi:hypothetical protein